MASRHSQQFQQGPPPPPHGRHFAPGIQGPRPMPQSAQGHPGPVSYQGPVTPSIYALDQSSIPGAPRRGPVPRAAVLGRQGSDLSIVPAGPKKRGNPKQKNSKAVAEGAIANPVSLFKEFNNALDRHGRPPKSLNFSSMTSVNNKGPTQAIDINAKWGSRSSSTSSHASSADSEDVEDAFMAGAVFGGATVGGMAKELVELEDDFGKLFGDSPESRTPSRKSSQAASSDSGSPFELPGGVSIGRRYSMGSSATGQSLTPSASRPHLPGKRVSSNFEWNKLSKPRAGVREDSLARIKQLNNKPHKKLLNMGNKPRSTGQANSSEKRQPRVDSFAEGSTPGF